MKNETFFVPGYCFWEEQPGWIVLSDLGKLVQLSCLQSVLDYITSN